LPRYVFNLEEKTETRAPPPESYLSRKTLRTSSVLKGPPWPERKVIGASSSNSLTLSLTCYLSVTHRGYAGLFRALNLPITRSPTIAASPGRTIEIEPGVWPGVLTHRAITPYCSRFPSSPFKIISGLKAVVFILLIKKAKSV
jgi:hypothetical protein